MLAETINGIAETDLNLRRCPFDCQRLEAVFKVLGFDTNEVVFQAEPMHPLEDSQRIKVPQWILKNTTSSVREHMVPYAGSQGAFSSFVFTIDVQRKPFFLLRLVRQTGKLCGRGSA
jgi:hypothetical protein